MKRQSFRLTILALLLPLTAVALASEPFMLKDINPGSGGSVPVYLTDVNGTLFFTAYNDTNGTELWKSDGTHGSELWMYDTVCTELPLTDLNGDCVVDFLDFAIMASEWLTCNKIPPDLCW